MKKSNYHSLSRRRALLGLDGTEKAESAKDKAKSILQHPATKSTIRDVLVGGLGGSAAGSLFFGRFSFLAGIVITGVGHVYESPMATGFGIGLMASGGYDKRFGLNGTEGFGGMEGFKERVGAYTDNLKRQFFIDKLPFGKKPKATSENENVSGIDPGSQNRNGYLLGTGGPDYTEANKLEAQLEAAARAYAQQNGINGSFEGLDGEEMEGLEGEAPDHLI